MHTILMKQPFATYEPLLRMIDRLEQIFMQTTGSTIEQHDERNNSSRRGGGGSSSSSNNRRHSTGTDPSGNPQHNPSHTPPAAKGSGSGGGGGNVDSSDSYQRSPSQQIPPDLSPRSDDSVTLVRVHALRSNVRELKKLESVSDYDGDEENEENDAGDDESRFIYAGDDQAVAERFGGHVLDGKSSKPHGLPSLPVPIAKPSVRLETHSDSDAAAMAMLSMKESLAGKVQLSDGADSGSDGTRGYKRKACAALQGDMNKRKMSVTAILN